MEQLKQTEQKIDSICGLNPLANNLDVSTLQGADLTKFLFELDNYYITYRTKLGFTDEKFEVAFDMGQFDGSLVEYYQMPVIMNGAILLDEWNLEELKSIEMPRDEVEKGGWEIQNLPRLYNKKTGGKLSYGMRVTSPSLTDTPETWDNIKNIFDMVFGNGKIDSKCFSSVYGSADILGDNTLYWYRFLKMITAYEHVIYRFMYGQYVTPGKGLLDFAASGVDFYGSKLDEVSKNLDKGVPEILEILNRGNDKYSKELGEYGISFLNMLLSDQWQEIKQYGSCPEHCTVEIKGNPTDDPIILQNNVNFLVRLMSYCKSPKFDEDKLDARRRTDSNVLGDLGSYAKAYISAAAELADMIFDNNLDKINFMRLYVKSFYTAREPFKKGPKLTRYKSGA